MIDMNWMLQGADLNTIWTSIFILIVGSFIGTIIYSRIYITIVRKGNTVFIDKNGKERVMNRFGTSMTGDFLGIKHAVLQFIIDFGKPFFLFWAILYPFATYVDVFSSMMVGWGMIGVMIGHNWPIWWKGKGGVGVASGVGILFIFSWLAGLIGFATWLIVAAITQNSTLGGGLGAVVGVTLAFIPGIMTNPVLAQPLTINTGIGGVAQFIIPFSLSLPIMVIKYSLESKNGFSSILKLFTNWNIIK